MSEEGRNTNFEEASTLVGDNRANFLGRLEAHGE